MNQPTRGQSSHTSGDDREAQLAQTWRHVPTDVLREFVIELVAKHRVRGVAAMAKLARDTVWKVAHGIGEPNFATRKALGELFLDRHAGGAMAEPDQGQKKWKLRPRLIELLPKGEGNARAAVSIIFQVARLFPKEVPRNIAQIEEWMDLQVRGEYWAERHYGEIARRANAEEAAGAAKRSPRRKRKPEASADGDE